MYFLIGLGIILVIVYGNMLLDYIKAKRNDRQQEAAELPEKPQMSGNMDAEEERPVQAVLPSSIVLADIIEEKLRQKQYIFGVPLTLCETDGKGKLIALDRSDNIYVIETAVRAEYNDFYKQVHDDMASARRRIGRGSDERTIYAIVCTNHPSEALKAAVEKDKGIRIFQFDMTFKNIM